MDCQEVPRLRFRFLSFGIIMCAVLLSQEDGMPKKPTSFSLGEDILSWISNPDLTGYTNRSALVESLLTALREDRIIVLDPPNPFPSQKPPKSLGHRSNPILVVP